METMPAGKVYLVGAGPGDPGLVTLRAVEILERADAVLYDYLVNPALLRHVRPGALLLSLGRHGRERVLTQAEVNERLVELAGAWPTVVRLKGGDPMVFARAAEELACLAAHGIPFEIVPGVTAAIAAASLAGIPLTQRDAASAVALVTGQEEPGKGETALDVAALARFPGTLAFYMGVTTVAHWSRALVAAGKPAATPVAIVRRVSLPDQERIDTTLGDVAEVVQRRRLRPPVVFLVGEVAAAGRDWSWFERRPLFGQTILVTRPADQAAALAGPLAERGAEILTHPVIEIRSVPAGGPLDAALARLEHFDWLVFSSANGVEHFFRRLLASGRDVRALGRARVAAIGPATAEALAAWHVRADLVPDEFRAEALAESLRGTARGQRFLLLRASRGREVLAESLAQAGGSVEQVVAYDSVDVAAPGAQIAARLTAGEIGWTTVTSSAIARSLVRLFGDALRHTRLASISPITSGTLRELGYEPAAEAHVYTMPGLVEAITAAVGRGSGKS
jgi:uroporphyrinogen III methyltransferase/synthase